MNIKAVTECISEGVLKDFLIKHRAEVLDVCITEYDEEEVMTAIRNESFEKGVDFGKDIGLKEGLREGLREGLSIGRNQMICILVRDGILEPEKAAKKLGITIEEFEKLMEETELE